MGSAGWLVGGLVPGLRREPCKKLAPEASKLLQPLERWSDETAAAGQVVRRICVAYEAGRDGVWLARWLRQRGIEAYVIHPTSMPVSREHRRAKSDRLDLGLLQRAFLGWLRGELWSQPERVLHHIQDLLGLDRMLNVCQKYLVSVMTWPCQPMASGDRRSPDSLIAEDIQRTASVTGIVLDDWLDPRCNEAMRPA